MTDRSRDAAAPAFGIDALVDGDSRAPAAPPGRPLRRDLHWWIGGGLVLLALPMLAWQAAGTEDGARRAHRPGHSASGGAPVRPPESTSALDRTIDDQARLAPPLPSPLQPLLPPLPPLSGAPPTPPDAGRSSLPIEPGPGVPGLASRSGAGRSAPLPLAPQAIDTLQSRNDALAAEEERRVAAARSSPLLALGSGGAGSGAASAAGAAGASPAALAALVRDAASMPGERAAAVGNPALAVPSPAPGGMVFGDARSDSAWLEQARAQRSGDAGPGSTLRAGPAGPALLEGTVIPAVLLTEINSDLPGTLVAQVTQDIWDSVHGRHLLVPKGSRLVGDYNSDVRPGQQRVLAAFRRLILPDGSSIDLQGTQATDAQGRSGLHDRVDRHFWTLFGSSFVVAALASLVQRREALPSTVIVVPGGAGSTASAVSSAAGNVLVETSRAILGRTRNVSPTLLISQGHRFSLTVQRTFLLDRKDDDTMTTNSR